jgi:hypothetical protein
VRTRAVYLALSIAIGFAAAWLLALLQHALGGLPPPGFWRCWALTLATVYLLDLTP